MYLAAGRMGRVVGQITGTSTYSIATTRYPARLQDPRLTMGMLDSAYPYLTLCLPDICRQNMIGGYRENRIRASCACFHVVRHDAVISNRSAEQFSA